LPAADRVAQAATAKNDSPRAVDYRLEDFRLLSRGSSVIERDLLLDASILKADLELTIEGASTLTVVVEDPEYRLLRSDLLTRWTWGEGDTSGEAGWIKTGRAVDAELDDVTFRLAQVKKSRTTLTLVFEERAVTYLRRHKGAKKVSRGRFTRAQFAGSLVAEVKADGGIDFVCPELYERQPIAKRDDALTKSERHDKAERGIDQDAKLTVKGAEATPNQIALMERVLDVAYSHKASPKAVLALVIACIQESEFQNLTYGHSSSVGILQLLDSHLGGSTSTRGGRRDVELVTRLFLTEGFTGRGGAIKLARPAPATPEGVTAAVQGNRNGARDYAPWVDEAKAIVTAYEGGGGRASAETYTKAYEFSRGKDEDTWTALGRLADEVAWRRFMRKGRLWFISEERLFQQKVSLRLREREGPVDWIDFDLDQDAANLVTECTVTVRADRWTVLPGQVVIVEGCGPADGRYLVATVARSLVDASGTATVTLRKPIPEKPEPASTEATRGTSEDGITAGDRSKVEAVYTAAVGISDGDSPYVYGGGHGKSLDSIKPGEGLDCSSSTSLALKRGGLFEGDMALVSGGFAVAWGRPGKGKRMTVWANDDHVWIEFNLPGKKGKRFDTSPHGSGPSGPHVRYTDRSTAGFTPRHWPGT
jgi:hypothetical protein